MAAAAGQAAPAAPGGVVAPAEASEPVEPGASAVARGAVWVETGRVEGVAGIKLKARYAGWGGSLG